jgi:hypothetical protein
MRRTHAYLCAAVLIFMLALAAISPYSSRTVKAAQQGDPCGECLEKVAKHYNNCIAAHGENDPRCGEKFNEETIHCYATVCEQ